MNIHKLKEYIIEDWKDIVCMYVCMCVCVYLYVCMYACVCVYVSVCMHVSTIELAAECLFVCRRI